MTKKSWEKVAADQFKGMPENFRDDWSELRTKVSKKSRIGAIFS